MSNQNDNSQNKDHSQENIDKLYELIGDLQDTIAKMKEDLDKAEGKDNSDKANEQDKKKNAVKKAPVVPKHIDSKGNVNMADPDESDYIIPTSFHSKRKKHHSSSHHSSSHHSSSHSSTSRTAKMTADEFQEIEKDFVYPVRRKDVNHHKRRIFGFGKRHKSHSHHHSSSSNTEIKSNNESQSKAEKQTKKSDDLEIVIDGVQTIIPEDVTPVTQTENKVAKEENTKAVAKENSNDNQDKKALKKNENKKSKIDEDNKNKEKRDKKKDMNGKKQGKKHKGLKVLGIIFAVLFSIIIVAMSTVLILNQVGKSQMHDYSDFNVSIPDNVVDKVGDLFVENQGKTIKYGGKTYTLNEEVSTIAFMGIDRDELINEGGNMADAIYIAVIDSKSNKVRLLCVSRETMADVDVYSTAGSFVDTENMQICLAYAYGDGKKSSSENVTKSLSRLFYGIPFKTYFAMDFSALKTLNDTVGGVTVNSLMPFKSRVTGQEIAQGEQITLQGDDSLYYVRYRDTSKLDSNNDRIARQEQYITAFLSRLVPAAKEDLSTVSDLYTTIRDNSTTSLTVPKITYLASSALTKIGSYNDVEFINLPGEVVAGEKFAEFHVDEKGLINIMLDVFYEEVK